MTESDLTRNTDFLLTESAIDTKIPIEAVLTHLRARRTSGTLSVDLHDGGVRAVRLAERTRIIETWRDAVRKILGMK